MNSESSDITEFPSSRSTKEALIKWVNVSKQYPKRDAKALDQVSFEVAEGEIVVLVGPNGAGKTTAMEMASGLRVPTEGSVTVLGQEVRPSGDQRLVIGVQLQEAGLPSRVRVNEAITAVSCLYQDPGPVDEIAEQLGLNEYLNSPVASLSGGWQRRVDVALACIGKPSVLVLDEPTSGIDPVARAEMWEFLRRRRSEGIAVLASTHDLSEAEAYADRLLVLNRGRLVLEGPVDEVLNQAGGQWRLRIIGAEPDLDQWITNSGHDFLASGDARVFLGDRETVTRLSEELESDRENGQVHYLDALRGPIRLEDVFAFAISTRDNNVISQGELR